MHQGHLARLDTGVVGDPAGGGREDSGQRSALIFYVLDVGLWIASG